MYGDSASTLVIGFVIQICVLNVCVCVCVCVSKWMCDTVDEVTVPPSAWDSDPVCVGVFVLEWYKLHAHVCVCTCRCSTLFLSEWSRTHRVCECGCLVIQCVFVSATVRLPPRLHVSVVAYCCEWQCPVCSCVRLV